MNFEIKEQQEMTPFNVRDACNRLKTRFLTHFVTKTEDQMIFKKRFFSSSNGIQSRTSFFLQRLRSHKAINLHFLILIDNVFAKYTCRERNTKNYKNVTEIS